MIPIIIVAPQPVLDSASAAFGVLRQTRHAAPRCRRCTDAGRPPTAPASPLIATAAVHGTPTTSTATRLADERASGAY